MSASLTRLSRRRFFALSGSVGAGLLVGPFIRPTLAATPKIVASEAWAHFTELAEGVWGVLSTPIESSDWRTGSNGGLVAGSERVLAIEGFLQPEGASWVAETAVSLAGRRPTDLLVTHHHGDHSGGLQGYADGTDRPRVWMTKTTRDIILEADEGAEGESDPVRSEMLDGASLLPEDKVTELDLGDRTVALHPRSGHTESDVSAEIADPSIVFFGDLLWNGFFPNYVHTSPTPFAASVRAGRRERETVYVPGHGTLADDAAVGRMLELIDSIEVAARSAIERGITAAEATTAYVLPAAVSDWTLFNPGYIERAITSWYKEQGVEVPGIETPGE
jgi:glyoxylase-like metal-dependent hydrolase (beta-lactamase superfamily II)